MAEWRTFAATGQPDTCLWCGRPLRHRVTESYDEVTEVDLDPAKESDAILLDNGYTTRKQHRTVVTRRADRGGDYEDGHFCGLRCGYQFGDRLADLDRRLEFRQGRIDHGAA